MSAAAATRLRIGLVGQVNAGKTSIHESLLRYRDPAAVSKTPGWTREVRSMALSIERQGVSEEVATLLDFPGFQRAEAMAAVLDAAAPTSAAPADDAPGAPATAPNSPAALSDAEFSRFRELLRSAGDFRHEELVIEHARGCHVLLLVVDSREAPGAAFAAEVRILKRLSGSEPLVLLNFTAHPGSRESAWRDFLRGLPCSDAIPFDAWHLLWANEATLWSRVGAALPEGAARDAAAEISRDRAQRRRAALHAAAYGVAEMIMDAAAMRRPVRAREDRREAESASRELMELARRREQACFDGVLGAMGFRKGDAVLEVLGISIEAGLSDPWSAKELRRVLPGVFAGLAAGAAVGGVVGAGVGFVLDLATMFTTIGAATALGAKVGAATGALAGGTYKAWDKLVDIPRFGELDARLKREAIEVLALRQIELVQGLLGRGHAAPPEAPSQASLGRQLGRGERDKIASMIRTFTGRLIPAGWSTLNGPVNLDDSRRVEAIRRLQEEISEFLEPEPPAAAAAGPSARPGAVR